MTTALFTLAFFGLWTLIGVAVAMLFINGNTPAEDQQQRADLRPRTSFDWDDFDARR